VIRLARDDWPAILEVHRSAFEPEDVPRIATELHQRPDLYVPELSFVAEAEDGAVVGHVMNTWNCIEETG
jgi:predicted N-acetyltransferase YhbS